MLGTFLCYFKPSLNKLWPKKHIFLSLEELYLCLDAYNILSISGSLRAEIELVCLDLETRDFRVEAVYLSWILLVVVALVKNPQLIVL